MFILTKTVSILLICLLVNLINLPSSSWLYAAVREPKQAQDDIEKVKFAVTEIGANPDIHVKVKLRDKTKVEGYISAINPDSFSVTKEGTARTTVVNYADVVKIEKSKRVKLPGRSSIFWPIVLGAAIVIFAVVVSGKNTR